MPTNDIATLRALADCYAEIANSAAQVETRRLWRQHNSFIPTRPPIYVRGIPWEEVPEVRELVCEDSFFREYEHFFRRMLYQATVGDDHTLEPFVTVGAVCVTPAAGIWGVETKTTQAEAGGSWMFLPPLKEPEDIANLVKPRHLIDEAATARKVDKLHAAIGDLLPIAVDRAPVYRMWNADISTQLAYLRGLEQVMWDMADDPVWLHTLLAFMRDGILAAHDAAEAAGDWRLCAHQNQAMPYAEELPDPSADAAPVARKQLWTFCAAQEFTLVSPAMHDEFLLQYQLPIIEKFGLSAYGCCEDLTQKIDLLRQIPNLRRIAVAPRADLHRCSEQIGTDYIISWRPNPAEMVSCYFHPDHVRAVVREAMEICRGLHVDITLKDIQTVQGDPKRLGAWTRIVREIAEEYGG